MPVPNILLLSPVQLVSPVPGADLIVRWASGGHISGSPVPVDYSVRQGGIEQLLQSRTMNSGGIMTDWSSTVAASPFSSGVLEFRMRRLFNGGDVWVNTFLDHVELEYPALFRAQGDVLRFGTGSADATVDVEVDGYVDRHELSWFDDLEPGVNQLTLPIRAIGERGGQMVVRLSHPDSEQIFVVQLKVDG